MNNKVLFSSKSDNWETPQTLFDSLNKEFNFNLDPCCNEDNKKCEKYFTKEQDGLKQDWGGYTVFVNPPYGRELYKWVKKSYEESKRANTKVVMLIPARTDTRYFHEFIYRNAKEIRFIKGRLKFGNSTSNAPFPSMIIIF